MILSKSLPCYACRPGRDLADLQRIIATGDVGLTIYRFRTLSRENDPPDSIPKETIIFYTTRNFQAERQAEMNLEIFEGKLSKCVNYCPRCKEMMRRIKVLYRDVPSTDRPTDLSELFSCPPCTDIVRKFRKFTAGAIREQDSELIHLTSPRYDEDVVDDAAKAELNLQTTRNLKHTEGINKDDYVAAGATETTGGLGGMKEEKREGLFHLQRRTSPLYDVDVDVAEAELNLQTTGNLKQIEGINKDRGVVAEAAETTGRLGGMKDEKIKELIHFQRLTSPRYDVDDTSKIVSADDAGKAIVLQTTGNLKHTKGINKHGVLTRTTGGLAGLEKAKREEVAVTTTKDLEEKKKGKTRALVRTEVTTGNLKPTEGIDKDGDGGAVAAGTPGGLGGIKKENTEEIITEKDLEEKKKGKAGAIARTEVTTGNLKHTEGIDKNGDDGAGAAGTPRGLGRKKKENTKEVRTEKKLEEKKKGKAGAIARTEVTTGNLKHTEGIDKNGDGGAGAAGTPKGLGGMKKENTKEVITSKDLEEKKKGKARAIARTEVTPGNLKHTEAIDKDGDVGAGITEGLGEIKEDKRKEIAVRTTKDFKENIKMKEKGKERKEGEEKEVEVTSKSLVMQYMKKIVSSKEKKSPKPVLISDQTDHLQERKERGIREQKAMKLMAVTAGATEADVQSSDRTDECTNDVEEVLEFIKGNKMCKIKPEAIKPDEIVERATVPLHRTKSKRPQPPASAEADKVSVQCKDGVLLYKLSDPKYLENGWTQLPKEVMMRKVTLFQMHPAHHGLWWLELNKTTGPVVHRSGEELATFEDNGTRLYYTSGELAMEYYKAEETNAGGHRVVVYSTSRPEAGPARPRTVLAMFDHAGNGEVYDHAGQLRLKYTQNDGITLDPNIGPHTHWKWHNLNDPPVFKTVLIEKQPLTKDPGILKHAKQECESISKDSLDENIMKSMETQNAIKEKKLKKYVPFQIKMRAFKINEHFSLRIHEQSSIFLSFSDGRTNIKINVGMILDPNVVVGEELLEVKEVHGFEAKPAGSESMESMQRVVQGARAAERARALRERRLSISPSYVYDTSH